MRGNLKLLEKRYKENLKEGFDENRFEQEIIFYLEKMDITEEKVRLEQHCKYFIKELNANKTTKGKKIKSQTDGARGGCCVVVSRSSWDLSTTRTKKKAKEMYGEWTSALDFFLRMAKDENVQVKSVVGGLIGGIIDVSAVQVPE